ncbi:hypothetical protein L6164_031745 [Bauhinia variegata]|uniref:Uncharacterized protein n=1 Tax=Bauhinia variegata TaxID=167791 RepID=A0ACB9KLM6_BAUVA|nr:hypothetical protein L6164_031745 [Bauhinia variegata]
MASDDRENSLSCFQDWMNLQAQDLSELLHNLDLHKHTANQNEQNLKQLAEKGIDHFKRYIEERSKLASADISTYYAPSWCSTWEISLLWIAGEDHSAEERLSTRLASLQEDIADQPLALIAKRLREVGEVNGDVEKVFDEFDKDMLEILREADNLRLATLEKVLQILSPLQAVDFLAASKKLHLCVHKWGKIKAEKHKREAL